MTTASLGGHLRIQHVFCNISQGTEVRLTKAPSSLKMAEAPMQSDGTIFLLQRRRRNVSEARSFLWNFQPISEEYSQPSPGSRFCGRDKDKKRTRNCTHNISQINSFSHLPPPLLPNLNSSHFIGYLLPWSYESLPAMDMVHFLRCNPGFGLIIRRNGDSVFPT